VLTRTATGWKQAAELKASDTVAADAFGYSVAISGTTAAVTTYDQIHPGRVYVFAKTATGWNQVAELTASDSVPDAFGAAMAISGTTAVVGAPAQANGKGAAYVFTKTGAIWRQTAELNDAKDGGNFGNPVAISGATIVVGASTAEDAGRAYVFTKTGAVWKRVAELKGSDTVSNDGFGTSVAISGTTAVVGAEGQDQCKGRAYVFTKTGAVWKRVAELKGSDTFSVKVGGPNTPCGSLFGSAVAISGTTVVVGADYHPRTAFRAYVFTKAATGWEQVSELKGPKDAGNGLGSAVAISGRTALVEGIGPVHVFEA
jgi:hypothetical protein